MNIGKEQWTLYIDDDHPGSLLRYRAHLYDPVGSFRGDNYFATKWGARRWARKEVHKFKNPSYGKRTVVEI